MPLDSEPPVLFGPGAVGGTGTTVSATTTRTAPQISHLDAVGALEYVHTLHGQGDGGAGGAAADDGGTVDDDDGPPLATFALGREAPVSTMLRLLMGCEVPHTVHCRDVGLFTNVHDGHCQSSVSPPLDSDTPCDISTRAAAPASTLWLGSAA